MLGSSQTILTMSSQPVYSLVLTVIQRRLCMLRELQGAIC